jgi:acetyltransferase
VLLNLKTKQEVKQAFRKIQAKFGRRFEGVSVEPMIDADGFEVLLGCAQDEQFGTVLVLGLGGRLAEEMHDRVIALPPLSEKLADQLVRQMKIYHALLHKKVDIDRLVELILRFSQLIQDYPEIRECDMNPLFLSRSQILVLDARFVIANDS